MLGWKYVEAQEESQRYKVGKFILETKRIRGAVDWESGGATAFDDVGVFEEINEEMQMPPDKMDEAVEFDSQDEDECEDLFAGVWSPQMALKRGRGRRFGRGEGAVGAGARARSEDVR